MSLGGELPVQPFYAMMHGDMQQVPSLGGTMYDEGQLFVYELFTKPMSEVSYKGMISATFGRENQKAILEKYPVELVCLLCLYYY